MSKKSTKTISGWHKEKEALKVSSLFPAQEKQRDRLFERKNGNILVAHILEAEYEVFRGVYQTSIDTEMMAECINIGPKHTFLEVGCGCGAVSLSLAKRCRSGLGVDISPDAVHNSIWNRTRLGAKNVEFLVSDVFQKVTGKFDVLVCNPPYNLHEANDPVERMFWDPKDEMKRNFFHGARKFLKRNGRIYFGWADFADLDGLLPIRLAESAGFRYVRHFVRPSRNGLQRFFVIVFRPD
jgi:release factor glutamine methyltransferase